MAVLADRRRARSTSQALDLLVGESRAIVAVKEKIARLFPHHAVPRRPPPVLITGETGTGKGLLARVIHAVGARAEGPFVDVNCAAIPETLLEAELFGFERGAFTDARQGKPGLFQAAHRGAIFLDEIGLLPEALQSKLLTVLEERTVRRLGATRSEPVDVMVLSATNEDLAAAVRARRFRADLYHRLAVLAIELPALRERDGDVLLLADRFLAGVCADYGLSPKSLGPAARAALAVHAWPGNVRELANVIERAALLAQDAVIDVAALGLGAPGAPAAEPPRPAGERTLREAVGDVERERLLAALEDTGWNVSRAAVRLGLSRNSIRYRLDKYGLARGTPPGARPRAGAARPPVAPRGVADEPRAPRVLRWQRRRLALLRAVAADSPAARGALPVEVLVEKVQSFGGRVLELGRSGLIGVFGLDPIEEAPRSAALAATAIVKAAEHHHRATGAGTGVRVGLHADQLLVGHLDGVPSLDSESRRAAIEILERVVAVAPPDVIALSSGAAALVERRFDVVPLASGENGVGPVYRLAGRERAGLDVEGRMTPFAGRRHEAALLDAVLATATTGRGQIVGIVGEAGIGKSRLLHEFRQSLAGRGVTYLAGQCVSYGAATPYLPALEMLRDACRLTEADTPESTAEKLRWHLTEIGMDAPEAAPYLLRLLGVREGTERLAPLTPEAVTTRTFDVLREMALAGSRRRPLVLAVENLHWIDASTEAYFGALADSLAGAPILLVCTFRPGRRPAWMDRSYATQVALAPLSREDSLAVVRSLPQASAIPPALADVIVDKADGNPFFLEELGRVVAQRPGAEESIEIPGTLQDVLLARMDRLAPETRRLLQVSAVVGREGPVRLLEAVWDGEGVAAPLGELKRLEFLDERLRGEETSFVFRHVLTHEVAYESLLPAERAQLHAAVGRVLEETHAGRLDEASGTLAHHFSRAGDAARAVEYLRRFADGAARSYAHAEAVTSLRAARAHAERLPAGRDAVLADLVLREGRSLHFLGRFAENRELLAQHAALVARLASPAANGHYHLLAGLTASHLGDPEAAAESASLAIAAAGACGDTRTLGRAHVLVGVGTLWSGRLREGLEHCRAATAVLDAAQDPSWLGQAHYVTGLLHFMRGEFPEALAAEAEADAIGAAAGDRRLRTHAAWTTGLVEVYGGRPAEGIACCQRAVEAAPDSFSAAAAESFLGCALKEAGRFDEAIERLEAAARRLERFRFRQQQGLATAWLSEALLGAGDAARAASAAARAVEITDEARYAAGAAVARRAVGRAALARGDAPTAVTALQDALARFQSMEMAYEAARTEHALTEALVATLNHS